MSGGESDPLQQLGSDVVGREGEKVAEGGKATKGLRCVAAWTRLVPTR